MIVKIIVIINIFRLSFYFIYFLFFIFFILFHIKILYQNSLIRELKIRVVRLRLESY